jgi:hypothetical protein
MNHTPDPILKWAALSAALLASVLPLRAVQAERQIWDTFADWAEGTAKGVAIEEPGRLVPAQVFTRATGLDATVVWTAAPGPDGSILVGTGGKGRVFRVARNGTASLLTEFTEPDVYAVAAGPRGEIYAAPSPGGKIFRRNAQGVFEEYFATGETYVWDLKVAPNGTLFAATGTQGKIFRITGPGRGEVWFDSDEPHIRRLLLDADGALLAGSAGKGLVYRILQKDRGVVLLDSGKEEITALALGPDQVIYAAAVANPGGSGPTDRPRSVRIQPPSGGGLAVVAEGSPIKTGSNNLATAERSGPSSRATCDLYVIEGDFYPRRLRELKDDILSLAHDGRRLLAGSGSAGKLYQVNKDGEFAALGQIDAESVTAITAGEGGVRLVTSGPSAVWLPTSSVGGTYTSKPMDSKLFARWGALHLAGQGEWRVRTRSGNTSDPDKSWHPWLPLDGDKVASPAARYLQIEITLVRGQVEQAELFFLPKNQPPRIESLRVLLPGVAYEPIQQPSPPPQPQTLDQLVKSPDGPMPQPVRFQPLAVRGARTVVWQAQDPNGDRLQYDILIRREGESTWELLEERLEQPVFSWDTTAWPDGAYRVQVRASDAPSNSVTDALKAEKISAIFTIDHTPPVLTLRRQTSTTVELDAVDATSPILAAYVSTNGFDFKPVLPKDGICDSRREVFEITIEPGKGLFLRVEDSHGNVAGWRLPASR